jgi:hypothetical protein
VFFFFDSTPYIAIIGDIIESKKITNRLEIQTKLNNVLEQINIQYPNEIESKFMITLGDEFQGLLRNGKNVMNIIEFIQIKMDPVHIRFGIGIGKISTEINQLMPFGADGSAYYNARNMIDILKNSAKKNKISDANIMISSDGEDNSHLEILLNTILSLCTTIKKNWTERQRLVAFDCMLNGDNQREVAARLSIGQPSVHKLLSKADYYSYKTAVNVVSDVLANIKVDLDV